MPSLRIVLAALVLAGAACTPDAQEAEQFSRPGLIRLADGSEAVDRGAATASDGAVEITMGEFFFEPTVVSARGGSTLEVRLVNLGQNVHNFEVRAGDVDVTIAENGTGLVSVRVPETGAVTFECKFHLPRAMRGEVRAV